VAFTSPDTLARLRKYRGAKAKIPRLDRYVALRGLRRLELDETQERLCCPLLVIHGDRDEYGSRPPQVGGMWRRQLHPLRHRIYAHIGITLNYLLAPSSVGSKLEALASTVVVSFSPSRTHPPFRNSCGHRRNFRKVVAPYAAIGQLDGIDATVDGRVACNYTCDGLDGIELLILLL